MKRNTRNSSVGRASTRGFSLVEVLVALIVLSVGLLGIAKIQAIAFSSTGNASFRSIAAIQAASLGAMMRANRAYWAVYSANNASIQITVSGSGSAAAATVPTLGASASPDCAATQCAANDLATYDLQQWGDAIATSLPPVPTGQPAAKVACMNTTPVNCTIGISWNEKLVATNTNGTNTAAATAISGTQTYILYVEP